MAATADPVVDPWASYSPGAEMVQALQATPGSDPGLLALINQPYGGPSRLDVIRPAPDVLNRRQFPWTAVPTEPGTQALGLDYATTPIAGGVMFVTVGSLLDNGPDDKAKVLRRRQVAQVGDPLEWHTVAEASDFPSANPLQMPYGAAFNADVPSNVGSRQGQTLYVTDAKAGTIIAVQGADFGGNPPPGAVQVTTANDLLKPTSSDSPFIGLLTGQHTLGATGIAVCPVGGTYMCVRKGDMVVVNTSLGWLLRVAVDPDRAPGARIDPLDLRVDDFPVTTFAADEHVTALQFGPAPRHDLFYAGGRRVWRIAQGGDPNLQFPGFPVNGCPDYTDVAVKDGSVFVANLKGNTSMTCLGPAVGRVPLSSLD